MQAEQQQQQQEWENKEEERRIEKAVKRRKGTYRQDGETEDGT